MKKMILLLFLSAFLLNEVHGDFEVVRGCPPKDANGAIVDDCNYYCATNEKQQYQEGYYLNGTRCKITHIPGVTEGVCIDLLGKEGCHPRDDIFARRFMKLLNRTTSAPITSTKKPRPTTTAITTTTPTPSTTKPKPKKNRTSTKKPKKPKKKVKKPKSTTSRTNIESW